MTWFDKITAILVGAGVVAYLIGKWIFGDAFTPFDLANQAPKKQKRKGKPYLRDDHDQSVVMTRVMDDSIKNRR